MIAAAEVASRRILVIRYGGFGDMILCMGAFRTIRAQYARDHVTGLTTPRFADLLRASGYFDEVLIDERLKPWRLASWFELARMLRGRRFYRVFDLQRNERTAVLYRILKAGRSLEWSGVVRGCSHYVQDDPNDRRHITVRLSEQLAVAGIPEALLPDLGWLNGEADRFALPPAYALLVPGGAPQRPEKRAPAEAFAGLAEYLAGQGITPVLLGTASERERVDAIARACPGAIDLSEQTSFGDIADLARGAVGAVGNDTGAMHLAAAAGCPSLVLFSRASDPMRVAPQGRRVRMLETETLRDLQTDRLIAAWQALVSDRD
ncbi:MAG TPA: glycosyltransferase family 9 protein [Stellaceae bacterium]